MNTAALVTFEIQTSDFNAFRHEFAKLVKKAGKLKVAAPTFCIIESDKVIPAKYDQDGTLAHRSKVVHVVTVSGQAPKLGGWTFLASLQHEEGGNIVRSVPGVGEAVNIDLRTVAANCDHCGLDRKRNDTYVVRHDDGRQLQVGRSCLKDFTGSDSPEAIARWAELLSVFVDNATGDREEGGFGGGGVNAAGLADFLSYVVASIRETGWMSRTAARDKGVQATADHAWISRFPSPLTSKSSIVTPTAEDIAKAASLLQYVVDHFDAQEGVTLSDYEHNVRIVSESNDVTSRTAGIAASTITFAERLIGNEIKRRKAAQQAVDSVFVGEVKKRAIFVLTVEKVIDLETAYGTSRLHIFSDAAGNTIKWFSSSERLDTGSTYSVKGTVKSHDVYQGIKQTMLTRCVCKEIEVEVAA